MSWREKAAKISKGPRDQVPKVTEPSSGTFGTDRDRHSESFQRAAGPSPLTPEEAAWFAGRAVACVNCAHFASTDGPVGECRRYRTEAFATPQCECPGYWPWDPALVALERRRAYVVRQLQADPDLKYSFAVADAPLTPSMADAPPVSIVLGVRMADGSIATGELRVPGDRWPGVAVFTEHWRQAAERLPA